MIGRGVVLASVGFIGMSAGLGYCQAQRNPTPPAVVAVMESVLGTDSQPDIPRGARLDVVMTPDGDAIGRCFDMGGDPLYVTHNGVTICRGVDR